MQYGKTQDGIWVSNAKLQYLEGVHGINDRLIWEIARSRMNHICSHMSSILGISIPILLALPTSYSLQTHVVLNTRVQALQLRGEIYAPCD